MNSLTRPRRGLAARILATIVVVPMLLAACTGATGGGGAAAGDPAAVVKDALAKAAAKDVAGLSSLVCAGQAQQIQDQLDGSGAFGGQLPGVDPKAIADAVQIDASGVVVGTPTTSGDTATVPLSGTMKLNVDKDKIRPIISQVMEARGMTVTDAQIDQVLAMFSSLPVNRSLTLKQENGAWKICQPSIGGDGASPSAPAGY